MGDAATQFGLVVLAEYFNEAGWFWGAGYEREELDALRARRGAAPAVGGRGQAVTAMAERDAPRTVIRPPPGPAAPPATTSSPGSPRRCSRSPPRRRATRARTRRRSPRRPAAAPRRSRRRRCGRACRGTRSARRATPCSRCSRRGPAANPALVVAAWTRARRKALPGVPEPDAARARPPPRRRGGGRPGAPRPRPLPAPLRGGGRRRPAGRASPPGLRWGLVVPLAVVLALAAWAGFAEWRFSARLLATLPPRPTCSPPPAPIRPRPRASSTRCGRRSRTSRSARRGSPLGLAPHLGRFAPGALARAPLRRGGRRAAARSARRRAGDGARHRRRLAAALRHAADARDPSGRRALAAGLRRRLGRGPRRGRPDPRRLRRARRRAVRPARRARWRRTRSFSARRGTSPPKATRPPSPSSSSRATSAPARCRAGRPRSVPDLGAVLVRRSGRPLSADDPRALHRRRLDLRERRRRPRRHRPRRRAPRPRRRRDRPAAPVTEEALLDVLQARTLDGLDRRARRPAGAPLHRPAELAPGQRHPRAPRLAARWRCSARSGTRSAATTAAAATPSS